MGMPCTVNSIVKLSLSQGYPNPLRLEQTYQAVKDGYRIIPMDVPIPLVDDQWIAYADIVIHQLTWQERQTLLTFSVHCIYKTPLTLKDM